MAGLDGVLEVRGLLRPCMVDGKKALFHRMYTHNYVIAPSPMLGGPPGGQLSFNLAVVEYENGELGEVPATKIKFLDTKQQMADFEACYYREGVDKDEQATDQEAEKAGGHKAPGKPEEV